MYLRVILGLALVLGLGLASGAEHGHEIEDRDWVEAQFAELYEAEWSARRDIQDTDLFEDGSYEVGDGLCDRHDLQELDDYQLYQQITKQLYAEPVVFEEPAPTEWINDFTRGTDNEEHATELFMDEIQQVFEGLALSLSRRSLADPIHEYQESDFAVNKVERDVVNEGLDVTLSGEDTRQDFTEDIPEKLESATSDPDTVEESEDRDLTSTTYSVKSTRQTAEELPSIVHVPTSTEPVARSEMLRLERRQGAGRLIAALNDLKTMLGETHSEIQTQMHDEAAIIAQGFTTVARRDATTTSNPVPTSILLSLMQDVQAGVSDARSSQSADASKANRGAPSNALDVLGSALSTFPVSHPTPSPQPPPAVSSTSAPAPKPAPAPNPASHPTPSPQPPAPSSKSPPSPKPASPTPPKSPPLPAPSPIVQCVYQYSEIWIDWRLWIKDWTTQNVGNGGINLLHKMRGKCGAVTQWSFEKSADPAYDSVAQGTLPLLMRHNCVEQVIRDVQPGIASVRCNPGDFETSGKLMDADAQYASSMSSMHLG